MKQVPCSVFPTWLIVNLVSYEAFSCFPPHFCTQELPASLHFPPSQFSLQAYPIANPFPFAEYWVLLYASKVTDS